MSVSSFFWRTLIRAVALWGLSLSVEAQIRFEPLLLSSNRVALSLLGEVGSSYAVEGSVDLVNWFTVFSGVAENGRLEFETDLQSGKMFFRGRADDEVIGGGTLDVKPALLTNYTSKVFVMNGGWITELFGGDRTKFTLTFPSNTVADALSATMTLVTNISGFPFAGRVLGAVRIDLEEEQLLGAAELSIKMVTNVDRRQVVSFVTELDGTDFSLTPDQASSNVVRIPVTRSGIFGSCLATPEEVAAVLKTINSSPAASGATVQKIRQRKILQTSRLCFPDKVNRALAIRNRIRRQMRQISTQLMAELNAERQAQLAGEGADSSAVLARAGALTCDFYNRNIAPRWTEAAGNCSLMNVLLQFSAGMERQLQLLGVPDGERCTANGLSPERLCPGFKACLQEIKACCSGGHPGKDRIRDIVTLARQQAVLGISGARGAGCFDLNDADVKEVIDICIPRIWRGTISVTETGKKDERTDFARGYTEETDSADVQFGGFVTEASENNFGSLGVSAHLVFEGPFIAREFRDVYSEADNGCQVVINRDTSLASTSASSAYSMDLSLIPQNKTYILSLVLGRSDIPFELPSGEESNEQVSTQIPPGIGCPSATLVMTRRTEKQVFEGPMVIAFVGTLGDNPNVIEGKYSGPGTGHLFETNVEISWRLERKISQ